MRPIIVGPDETWSASFREIAQRLRGALGEVAVRIDHIGSTSVPGLAAKDVIDVQVAVRSLDVAGLRDTLASAGFRLRDDIVGDHRPPGADGPDGDWAKRYASEVDGERRAHVHIRVDGAPNQRYALLFRDYLRAHRHAAEAYERAKRGLASVTTDTQTYAEIKDPVCDLVMIAAEEWAAATAWGPGESDA